MDDRQRQTKEKSNLHHRKNTTQLILIWADSRNYTRFEFSETRKKQKRFGEEVRKLKEENLELRQSTGV